MAKAASGGNGGGGDILLLGAVGLVAFMMMRHSSAAVVNQPIAQARGNVPGAAAGFFNATGAMLRGLIGTGSPDVVLGGGYTNGSTGGFDVSSALLNATSAVGGQVAADTAAGAGVTAPYDWSQWAQGATDLFTLPAGA